MASEPGIFLDGKMIGLLIGMITLATAGYTGVSTINAYAFKVDAMEHNQTRIVETMEKFEDSVSNITKEMTNLTIAINRLSDRYDALEKKVSQAK